VQLGCSTKTAPITLDSLSSVQMGALTPSSVTLPSSGTQQFSTTVSGGNNATVVWSLEDSSGAGHGEGDASVGTVTSAGFYTAPIVASGSSPKMVIVSAAAAADTSIARTAAVTINPMPAAITVTVTPSAVCVATGQPQAFSATVVNGSGVSWLVDNIPGGNSTYGTIDSSGNYVAPGTAPAGGAVTVTAQSVQQPSASGSAIVQVQPSCQITVAVNPSAAYEGQTVNLTATVPISYQNTDPAVTWSVSCAVAPCGSIGALTGPDTAQYIAPSSIASNSTTVTVKATLDANPSLSGQQTITVVKIVPVLTVTAPSTLATGSQAVQLSANLTGVPSGISYSVTWTACVSNDEDEFLPCSPPTPQVDGDGGEGDGPGTISPTSTSATSPNPTTTSYTAPTAREVGSVDVSPAVQQYCTAADGNNPYVLITTQASFTVNGNPSSATGRACIALQ
jgi:hypothetical protein